MISNHGYARDWGSLCLPHFGRRKRTAHEGIRIDRDSARFRSVVRRESQGLEELGKGIKKGRVGYTEHYEREQRERRETKKRQDKTSEQELRPDNQIEELGSRGRGGAEQVSDD